MEYYYYYSRQLTAEKELEKKIAVVKSDRLITSAIPILPDEIWTKKRGEILVVDLHH